MEDCREGLFRGTNGLAGCRGEVGDGGAFEDCPVGQAERGDAGPYGAGRDVISCSFGGGGDLEISRDTGAVGTF